MRTQSVRGTNGKMINFLIPETPEDHQQLQQMIAEGKASANASFGDWKWSKDKGKQPVRPGQPEQQEQPEMEQPELPEQEHPEQQPPQQGQPQQPQPPQFPQR